MGMHETDGSDTHSSTGVELTSLDAGPRMEGSLAFKFWDVECDVLGHPILRAGGDPVIQMVITGRSPHMRHVSAPSTWKKHHWMPKRVAECISSGRNESQNSSAQASGDQSTLTEDDAPEICCLWDSS